MKNIYFYPQFDYEKDNSPNPYIDDFQKSLGVNLQVINVKVNHKGVLDLFQYIQRADIYIFNWIEDLPIYKFGKLQTLFFLLFLVIVKVLRKKIVWILHNKYSHFSKKNQWTDFMYKILMKYSDLIITHSQEGISFVEENYPYQVSKVCYINHPMREKPKDARKLKKEKEFDFLIWGTIQPYKGILEFLTFLNTSEEGKKIKLLIAGKCFDKTYKKKLLPYLNRNITFKDDFFSLEKIREIANQANFILFTHKSVSVLSSGALMDTVGMGVKIIGPDHGAFKDLSSLSFIYTYKKYEDILKLNQTNTNTSVNFEELTLFYSENTWEGFGNYLDGKFRELF